MLDVLGFIEHVVAKHALVQARSRDRRHMMKMAGGYRAGQRHGVARALDVHRDLAFLVGRQVVDRRQVIDMIDPALELLDVRGCDAQGLFREVAEHRNRLTGTGVHPPIRLQAGDLAPTLLADQEMHRRILALQKSPDQAFADETGRAGD